jgi:hypothetical protein
MQDIDKISDLTSSDSARDRTMMTLFYLQEIEDQDWYTQRELRDRTTLAEPANIDINSVLKQLRGEGLVDRDKGGKYRLTGPGLKYCVQLAQFKVTGSVDTTVLNPEIDRDVYERAIESHDEYLETVAEINSTYRGGHYASAAILLRKLFESLLYDILQNYYADETEMYLNNNKPLDLSPLIDNFKDSQEKWVKFSDKFNADIRFHDHVKTLQIIRRLGNFSAHALGANLDRDDLTGNSNAVSFTELFEELYTLLYAINTH